MFQGHTESSADGRHWISRKVLTGLGFLVIGVAAFLPFGCGKKPTQAKVPVPPPIAAPTTSESKPPASPKRISPPPAAAWTQLGIASWYVPEPAGRKTASGEPYERTALTAAHCTLPLNTLVRVTNLSTHSEAIVRINDRGPFMAGRIIDLSVAAAKAVDVWRAGIAKVRLEVVEAPLPIETGGRWCVQIGAFRRHIDALGMKETVTERYRPSRVLEFAGATGYWVRVRVKDDDRNRAQELASKLRVEEGGVFLVRLD
jgi:rare lipoprotein A